MATLVQRLRATISAESDDFFEDDTLVDYLNASQQRIVSYLVALESSSNRTFRALDELRKNASASVVATPTLVTGLTGVFTAEINVPSDLLQLHFLRYKENVTARELPVTKIRQIWDGNAKPTANEIYYHFSLNGSTKRLTVYTYEATTDTYRIFYTAKPTDVTDASEAFVSIPAQLENAAIYGAAEMALMQESVKDPNNSIQAFTQLYKEELNGGMF